MSSTHFLCFAALSMVISISAALRRSHIFLVISSLNMAISGAVILLATNAKTTLGSSATSYGLLIIGLSTIINLIFCGVAILGFRSRGRLRMDDYRDLRG